MSIFKRKQLSTTPGRPLLSPFSNEMDRFWTNDSLFARRQGDLLGEWQPNVDIQQKNNMYLVRADIPGVDPKEIRVSMDNGNLIIEGHKENKIEENRDSYRCVERQYGSFYRCINLPEAADAKSIEAHSKNGVLEIDIPIIESAKQKKVEVQID